ncbi:hypothetical protein SDC9_120970 [bioreactor metagenome]|uniref:Uncharacterized protein n=1 Tax=bioreactor metagenome TaxID=1076179 RepID=A0A645CAN4_9ZZZZ
MNDIHSQIKGVRQNEDKTGFCGGRYAPQPACHGAAAVWGHGAEHGVQFSGQPLGG